LNAKAEFFCEQDMEDVEVRTIARGVAAVFSARSPEKDTPNEDSAALIPFDEGSGVLMVADGLGGGRAGEQASSLAVHAFADALKTGVRDGALLRTAILIGFERANQAVGELGFGAATTLAAVEIQESSMRPYHVGDSAILVVGQRAKIKLRSISHSPVGFAVEAGVLDEADAMHHEDRHLVSNVLGSPDMRLEIGSTLELAPNDTLLLASDGLVDNLHTAEIVELIRTGPIDETARRLAETARARMCFPAPGEPSKPDDITCVTFRRTRPRS
jgi:serine/threonine protein phosphatase PrpC